MFLLKIEGCLSKLLDLCLLHFKAAFYMDAWSYRKNIFCSCCLAFLNFFPLRHGNSSVWLESPLCLHITFFSLLTTDYSRLLDNMDDQQAVTLNKHPHAQKHKHTHTILQTLKRWTNIFLTTGKTYLVLWKWNETTHTGDEPILSWLGGAVFNNSLRESVSVGGRKQLSQ